MFPALALKGDDRDRIPAHIGDVELDDLLDTGTGVVEQQQQRPASATLDGIDRLEQCEDFVLIEVLDLRVLKAGRL